LPPRSPTRPPNGETCPASTFARPAPSRGQPHLFSGNSPTPTPDRLGLREFQRSPDHCPLEDPGGRRPPANEPLTGIARKRILSATRTVAVRDPLRAVAGPSCAPAIRRLRPRAEGPAIGRPIHRYAPGMGAAIYWAFIVIGVIVLAVSLVIALRIQRPPRSGHGSSSGGFWSGQLEDDASGVPLRSDQRPILNWSCPSP
jgi:hypothetical protein